MSSNPASLANLRPYQPGQSGNPAGKPKGTRNRLTLQSDFMRRLAEDFEHFGIYAIARVRRHEPAAYIRVIAALMPKEFEITRPLDDITDDELAAALATVRAIHAAQSAGAGAGETEDVQPAAGLPALPEAS